MNVTLQEAIEIYAEVLCVWKFDEAPREAQRKALELKAAGDEDGHDVWLLVAEMSAWLLYEKNSAASGRSSEAPRSCRKAASYEMA